MKPAYIILTETGERFDLNKANEFNPNEFAWVDPNDSRNDLGLYIDPNDLTESYCYRADYDERFMDENGCPDTATTIGFKAYDNSGNILFEDEGGNGFWL